MYCGQIDKSVERSEDPDGDSPLHGGAPAPPVADDVEMSDDLETQVHLEASDSGL